MLLPIVSPAPTILAIAGSSGDSPGDLQNLRYPRLYAGRYFLRKGCKSTPESTPWCICCDSRTKVLGVRGGDLPGDLQEKSRAVPGAVPWRSQSTKLNPCKSPLSPGSGAGVTIDSRITLQVLFHNLLNEKTI